MPLSDISKERLAQVHPKLSAAVQQMDAMAPELNLQVVQGERTWPAQDALYAQGRTAPGKVVTNAAGGYSWHNFGLAVDLVPEDIQPGQPDWNVSHPAWQRMISLGESMGLTSGSTWRTFPDNPHFQMTGRLPVDCPDDATRQLFKDGGMSAVWQATGLDE